jgi:F-type H+-transporting ATPase subunit delta
VTAVHESIVLRRVWESPAIPAEQKRAVLDALARQIGAARQIRNFIAILIDHRRIRMLDHVAKQFDSELNAQLGLEEAEIFSARPLLPDGKRVLELHLERLTGKKVRATYSSDPGLLGGVVVRMGSTIYDGSVRGQLEKMKQDLSRA